jgi:hypothetical protein
MVKLKKFTEGSTKEEGIDPGDIIGSDDWVLSWSPKGRPQGTGFTLFTPKAFDPDMDDKGPVGGLILAALYFLVEHGNDGFPEELISRANALSKEIAERDKQASSMKTPPGRILN